MKASDIFVKILEKHGVKTIYGVPGEENLDFLDSLSRSKIELIVTRNEQTAVFMAATYGRFTGKIGVALSTLGPGATNLITGVGYAQLGAMPVLVITGQKPIKKSKQGGFQIIDVVAMMKPITKYSKTITSGSRIPYVLNNAIKIAEEERHGAVHIELPEDIAGEELDIDENHIHPIPILRRPNPDDKIIKLLIDEIEKAKSPIILIGAGTNRKRVTKYLTKFIKKYNIPYFTSQMGKGVVEGCGEQYLGTAALTTGDYIHEALDKSDLILSVGYDTVEKPTKVLCGNSIKVIHINFYITESDVVYAPYMGVIGDIGYTFWKLYEKKIDNSNWNFDDIYKIREKSVKKIHDNLKLEDYNSIMMPRKFVNDLREALDVEDILALDNGLYKVWIARNYRAYKPNTLLLDNAFAAMGAGLASAMEAKRINPDKKVVCVTGDGGIVMNLGDLETAVRLKLDLVVIILNNKNYGMIRWKQKDAGFKDFGLSFNNPDFVKLAESFGAKGYKVIDKNDFSQVLIKALDSKGINIIDLDFEYPDEIK
ncbi:MAG: acetolactate synthase large subunit [Candidatus Gracilibacteria bacterium]